MKANIKWTYKLPTTLHKSGGLVGEYRGHRLVMSWSCNSYEAREEATGELVCRGKTKDQLYRRLAEVGAGW